MYRPVYTMTFQAWALARVHVTNTCQLAQHGFIYKSICDGIYVYLWAHVCMQRGSKCEHSQGHRHMWVFTTWVHIKKSICNMIYVYFWVYLCIQRGSNCEHSQGHKHMWVRTTCVHIQNYPWYDVCILILVNICMQILIVVNICMQRGSKCDSVSTRNGTYKCEIAQHGLIYKRICDGIYVYMWHMYVCKEVLTVSTGKGTDICEFAQHGVIHKSICNMKFVYLWVYLCRQRGSNCEQSQGHKHICVFAQRGFIYKTIHDTMYVH